MRRAQNRAAKGSILKEDEIYIIYINNLSMVCTVSHKYWYFQETFIYSVQLHKVREIWFGIVLIVSSKYWFGPLFYLLYNELRLSKNMKIVLRFCLVQYLLLSREFFAVLQSRLRLQSYMYIVHTVLAL